MFYYHFTLICMSTSGNYLYGGYIVRDRHQNTVPGSLYTNSHCAAPDGRPVVAGANTDPEVAPGDALVARVDAPSLISTEYDRPCKHH